MRASRIAVAVAVLGLAGAARADSPIQANYVDAFDVQANARAAANTTVPVTGALAIPANYVDDFGSLVPASVAAQREELGAASGEPGQADRTIVAQHADAASAAQATQHDRFVHEVWARP